MHTAQWDFLSHTYTLRPETQGNYLLKIQLQGQFLPRTLGVLLSQYRHNCHIQWGIYSHRHRHPTVAKYTRELLSQTQILSKTRVQRTQILGDILSQTLPRDHRYWESYCHRHMHSFQEHWGTSCHRHRHSCKYTEGLIAKDTYTAATYTGGLIAKDTSTAPY